MAQEVEEITELLNQIKDDADKNSQSFEKLLSAINNRLEIMANDTESDDLIKVYLNELKKILEERQSFVNEEFQKISNSFATLVSEQEKLPTTEKMKDMLSVISNNMLVFSRELQEQKDSFSNYIKDFERYTTDKQDKSDIIQAVSLIKSDIEVINNGFETSISEINANIQSIFKNLVVMDPTAQNDIVKRELENVYISTTAILTALHAVEQKNDDLLANLYNFATKDDVRSLEEKFEMSSSKLDNDFVVKADAILTKIEPLADKSDLEKFSNILDSLRISLTDSNAQTNNTIREQLDKLNNTLANVVTDNDFTGFRHDLADFIQKIIDNSTALNHNLNVNKETLTDLINKVENLDVHKDMEEISNALKTIKETASTNLNTIVEEVNNMSGKIDFEPVMSNIGILNETISSNSEEIKNMQGEILRKITDEGYAENFKNIYGNIDSLRETFLSAQNSNEVTLSEKLLSVRDMILTGISTRDEKFSGLHEKLDKLVSGISSISANSENTTSDTIAKIDEMKQIVEDISKSYSELNYNQNDRDTKLVNTISSELADITTSLNSLQDNIPAGIYSAISPKIESIDDKISQTVDDISLIKGEILNKNSDASFVDKLQILTNNVDFAKESLLSATEAAGKDLTEKLLGLRDIVTDGLASRDENFAQIRERIDTFVENYSNIASNTEIKVGNSISEIAGLKAEIENITKGIAEWNYNQDDRDSKLAGVITNELGEITSTLETLQDGIQAGLHQEISKNTELVENQINNLIEYIDNVKTELANKEEPYDFAGEFKEVKDKITAVKQEINLVNTDITDILTSKAESVLMEILPVKTALENLNNLKEDLSNKVDEVKDVCNIESLKAAIEDVNSFIGRKFDAISEISNFREAVETCANNIKTELAEKINSNIGELKTAITVATNNDEMKASFEDLKSDFSDRLAKVYNETSKNNELLSSTQEKIDQTSKDLEVISDGNTKISGLLDIINQKVDILATADEDEDYTVLDEIDEIKNLISSQRNLIENTANSDKVSAIENKLEELISKIDNIETSDLKEMRETILTAILSVFEQISFIEESEDIKDFVEEKTDEINESIRKVQQQLKQIVDDDYAYTLQDVESDIAKLRMVLNDLSNTSSKEEISDISDNIHRIVSTVEDLQNSLTQEQMSGLKSDFERLSEDVLSISSRTNKLLLTSDESYNALNDGLNDFSNVIHSLEERISHFDNKEISERIEEKIDNTYNVVTASANSDKVMRQALMYMGEWIDNASENIENIYENSEKIEDVQAIIEELESKLPEQKELLQSLEDRFEEQQNRMDRLEMKLEKILSAIDDLDDNKLTKKVDKIEKQITKLSNNIEKLASYVDE